MGNMHTVKVLGTFVILGGVIVLVVHVETVVKPI